ncbi:MAG: DUF2155 domain-containing protein [Acetobacteraceae bacterium]|nr:DUF2155 domain-containing protein [Acetobacteraceae bacterium]MBV8591673.1 DUF2155 domain-containing protein [Acetobacteraceae bacterium]
MNAGFWCILALIGLAPVIPAAAQDEPAPDTPPPAEQVPEQNIWLPHTEAELQVLDKVNARSQDLQVKTGQSVQYGTLTISVQACMLRPPDQAPDAAGFLVITDRRPGAPGFKGWMLQSAPASSMLENPIYDVRVIGCR